MDNWYGAETGSRMNTMISFESIYMFWLLIPILVLVVFSRFNRRRSMFVTLLRMLSLTFLIIALADPTTEDRITGKELAAAVDVSYSVTPQGRAALVSSLRGFLSERTNIFAFPFGKNVARQPIVLKEGMKDSEISSLIGDASSSIDTGETNIALALSTISSRTEASSILLLTDGFETEGNGVDVARSIAPNGTKLFPLIPDDKSFRGEGLSIVSLNAPVTVGSGDRVEVSATVHNSGSESKNSRIEIWLGEEKILSQPIAIPAGEERLVIAKTPPLKNGGLQKIRAVLVNSEATSSKGAEPEDARHRWISIKEKSKILLLNGSADDERYLKRLFSLKGYALQDIICNGTEEIPTTFSNISTLILNNVSKKQLPAGFLDSLKAFVQSGGGLLIIGGDRSFGLGGYIDTPLEEISPVKFVPPQTEKRRLTNAVALVIDKSGSMAEEEKIDSARDAALMSINTLNEQDFIGVIGFDSDPFVIIDIKPVAEVKYEAERRLRNLTAAGKTNLLPALSIARQRLDRTGASRKHIIVLSDGKIPLTSTEYAQEINALKTAGITVSAVALGIDADVPFMKMMSQYGHGAFYHTLDARQLPKIFIEDIKVSTGEKTLTENGDFPVGVGPGGLRSVSGEGFPSLKGFVETLPKKGSELELITKKEDRAYPVLSSWRYGNGKVAAYSSDANGRWSQLWANWEGFSPFWTQLVESVKEESGEKSGDVDFDLRYSVNRKSLLFDLAIFDDKLRTQASPKVVAEIVEPGGATRQLSFRQTKRGRFEAKIDNGKPGDYRLNVSYGALKLPELGIYLHGELFGETRGNGINVGALSELAFITSGVINPSPQQLIASEKVTTTKKHFYIPFVIIGFLLLLVEAFVRERWSLR